jgi:hypothetical protein
MQRKAKNYWQHLGSERKAWNTLSLKRKQSIQHLDFGLLSSKTVRELTSVVLSHQFALATLGYLFRGRGSVLGRGMKMLTLEPEILICLPYSPHSTLVTFPSYSIPML